MSSRRTGDQRLRMDPVHVALLRTHRLYLSGQLLVTDAIVPFLYQEDILSGGHVEDIEAQTTSTLRCLKLLDLLPTRGPRAFHCFLRSLEDYGWVRDQLLVELQTGPAPGPSLADVRLPDTVLQEVPSDRVLSRLASRLGAEWESVLMDLGLSAEDLFRCRSDHHLSTHGVVLAGLVRWKQLGGKTATVQRLLRSLLASGLHPSVLEDALL